jgi:hypothetical protein
VVPVPDPTIWISSPAAGFSSPLGFSGVTIPIQATATNAVYFSLRVTNPNGTQIVYHPSFSPLSYDLFVPANGLTGIYTLIFETINSANISVTEARTFVLTELPPGPPAGVTVTEINLTTVRVGWNAPTIGGLVETYSVFFYCPHTLERIEGVGGSGLSTTNINRIIGNLTPGTDYKLRVGAHNAGGTTWSVFTEPFTTLLHPTVPNTPTGPFPNANTAALAWSNYIYSTSLFIVHEHAAMIYRTAPGVYWLTATRSGGSHVVSPPRHLIPADADRIAGVHTHPNGPEFSPDDRGWARSNRIPLYAAAPTSIGATTFRLMRFDSTEHEDGEYDVISNITLNLVDLTLTNRTTLENIYRLGWERHLPCSADPDFLCNTRIWPRTPWPPQ